MARLNSVLAGLRVLIAVIGMMQLAVAASAAPRVLTDGAPSAVLAAAGPVLAAAKPWLPQGAEVAVAPEAPVALRGPVGWVTAVSAVAGVAPRPRAALPWARGPPFA